MVDGKEEKKSLAFISWMIPLFKPEFYDEGEYIYSEGEHIENIYF